jgi:hypothetical protein
MLSPAAVSKLCVLCWPVAWGGSKKQTSSAAQREGIKVFFGVKKTRKTQLTRPRAKCNFDRIQLSTIVLLISELRLKNFKKRHKKKRPFFLTDFWAKMPKLGQSWGRRIFRDRSCTKCTKCHFSMLFHVGAAFKFFKHFFFDEKNDKKMAVF